MDLYGHGYSMFDLGFSDPSTMNSVSFYRYSRLIPSSSSTYIDDHKTKRASSPPRHRHDGTSPLPLGMDWSPAPRKWDGRNTVWPLGFQTGWSYCVTVPSWSIATKSKDSDAAVFYSVQVGIQSPEGITTTQRVLRRFRDFLKLHSELKTEFPRKNFPTPPPKRLLRMKSQTLLEERRSSLEEWMEKLLSDIDLSRSVPTATFLELEAAARLSFYNSYQNVSDVNSPLMNVVESCLIVPDSDPPLVPATFSFASDNGNDVTYETSELGTRSNRRDNYSELGLENTIPHQDVEVQFDTSINASFSGDAEGLISEGLLQGNQQGSVHHNMLPERDNSDTDRQKVDKTYPNVASQHEDEVEHYLAIENPKSFQRRPAESPGIDSRASESSNFGLTNAIVNSPFELSECTAGPEPIIVLDLQFPNDLLICLPMDERHKVNRFFVMLQQRLAVGKTDVEDLMSRLNQELAVRQYLETKVKDLEVELDTTKQNCKENLEQAVLLERERFTHLQWDTDELRRKCMEMELTLDSEQDDTSHMKTIKSSIIVHENEMLLQELDAAKRQIDDIQKCHDGEMMKSKADFKLLVKEVKSLRISLTGMKQELDRLTEEKIELEKVLQKEMLEREHVKATNAKLLHECEILCKQLEGCSINFLIEAEDKLIVDASSPSDVINLLETSDNWIGRLLDEAQLLAQDDINIAIAAGRDICNNSSTADDDLRKMLKTVLIDNARLRKQVNAIIRCALTGPASSEQDGEEAPSEKSCS